MKNVHELDFLSNNDQTLDMSNKPKLKHPFYPIFPVGECNEFYGFICYFSNFYPFETFAVTKMIL